MEEVYPKLYVGSDDDFWKAEMRDFSICTVAKDGPHGHRSMLGYKTQAAPKGPNYLSVRKGRHLAINLIDADDPAYINDEAIGIALKFIDEQLKAGHKVLVQCNKGISRGPSTAMCYLRKIGDLPPRYHVAFRIFKTLYPKYDPNLGMEHYVKQFFKKHAQADSKE